MKSPRNFFIAGFLCCCGLVHAQGVTVSATVDRNRILIGESIQLKLEANIPENEPIRFFLLDSIPHFEMLEITKTDTINTNNGTRLIRTIPLTSFDSGHWVIPAFELAGGPVTDTIPVDVVFSDFDPNQPYHDIKDIIEVTPAKKRQWWWYAAGGGLLLIILLIYFLTRKKKVIEEKPTITIDPFTEAIDGLDKLKRSNPAQAKLYKDMVDIFRVYIFRKKGILSLQKTTDDLVIQLRDLGLEKNSFDKLAQALRMSDFVKFAKYLPAKSDDEESMDTIRKSIEQIERLN